MNPEFERAIKRLNCKMKRLWMPSIEAFVDALAKLANTGLAVPKEEIK